MPLIVFTISLSCIPGENVGIDLKWATEAAVRVHIILNKHVENNMTGTMAVMNYLPRICRELMDSFNLINVHFSLPS